MKLDFLHADRVDFSEYSTSTIWDMIDAPAVLTEDRSRIEFQIRIRFVSVFFEKSSYQKKNAVLHCSTDSADSLASLSQCDGILFADSVR